LSTGFRQPDPIATLGVRGPKHTAVNERAERAEGRRRSDREFAGDNFVVVHRVRDRQHRDPACCGIGAKTALDPVGFPIMVGGPISVGVNTSDGCRN
jgi:hypothetical protein